MLVRGVDGRTVTSTRQFHVWLFKPNSKVKKCAQFGAFTNLHLKKVAQCFAEEYFQSGSTVIKEGDVGSRFYIIKSGTASVRKGDEELAILGSGESFGEISLLGNKARNAGERYLMSLKRGEQRE